MFDSRANSSPDPAGRTENPPSAFGRGIDGDVLFETLICDLHWSVLHIATMSSLSNACLQTDAEWTLRPWRHILHDNSKIVQLALRYCAEMGIAADVGDQISKMYEELSAVKSFTMPLTRSMKDYSAEDRRRLTQVASKWRQLSQVTIRVMHSIEPGVKRRLVANYSEDGRALVRFLTESAGGETNRVGARGEISLPTLTQRRQAPRIEVRRNCRLVSKDLNVAAVLYDVSRNGLGVICAHPLVERQTLVVELEGGRRLNATVVRKNGDRVGLSLPRSLPGDDDLFRTAGSKSTASRR